jgi:hypothetical protein
MGGMAQELYAIYTRNAAGAWQPAPPFLAQDNALAAGDYNARADDAATWNNVYKAYYNDFGGTNQAGAEAIPLYDNAHAVGTVVQTNDGFANFGPPINSANPNDYYRAPIDEMFQRIPNIHTLHRYTRLLVPELIVNAQALAGVPVRNFKPSIDYAIANHDVATGPIGNGGPLHGPGNQYYRLLSPLIVNDWADFQAGINQGYMPDARSAALFYRTFISDHLPLLIDFQV